MEDYYTELYSLGRKRDWVTILVEHWVAILVEFGLADGS